MSTDTSTNHPSVPARAAPPRTRPCAVWSPTSMRCIAHLFPRSTCGPPGPAAAGHAACRGISPCGPLGIVARSPDGRPAPPGAPALPRLATAAARRRPDRAAAGRDAGPRRRYRRPARPVRSNPHPRPRPLCPVGVPGVAEQHALWGPTAGGRAKSARAGGRSPLPGTGPGCRAARDEPLRLVIVGGDLKSPFATELAGCRQPCITSALSISSGKG